MFIASSILDLITRLQGPKARQKLHINRTLRWGTGEPEWILLDHLVDPTRASIDAGANNGDYTGRLAQLCGMVHAFEPVPWLADDLVRKSPANVAVHRIALSNRMGEAELRIPTRAGIEDACLTTMEELNPLRSTDAVRIVGCVVNRLDNVISEPVKGTSLRFSREPFKQFEPTNRS
jgi:FkbM family methyltransferase